MTISGKKINYTHFLFDGCHKFYLTNERKITDDMVKSGYVQGDLRPIDELPYQFYNSCSLRFIQTWKDFKTIVPQCRTQVKFSKFGKYAFTALMNFRKDKVYTDEPCFPGTSSNVVFKRMSK